MPTSFFYSFTPDRNHVARANSKHDVEEDQENCKNK
jgi:hypothetical protein